MHQKVPVLLLHPPIVPLCEDSILNTSRGVGGESCAFGVVKGRDGLDEADGADGDQILLVGSLGVVLLEDAFLKAVRAECTNSVQCYKV